MGGEHLSGVARRCGRGAVAEKQVRRGEVEIKFLCSRWLEGQRLTLWQQTRESKHRAAHREDGGDDVCTESQRKRAIGLARLGLARKACAALGKCRHVL